MLRAAVDLDADATIVSLDGRSAYDTISRAAFMSNLAAFLDDVYVVTKHDQARSREGSA